MKISSTCLHLRKAIAGSWLKKTSVECKTSWNNFESCKHELTPSTISAVYKTSWTTFTSNSKTLKIFLNVVRRMSSSSKLWFLPKLCSRRLWMRLWNLYSLQRIRRRNRLRARMALIRRVVVAPGTWRLVPIWRWLYEDGLPGLVLVLDPVDEMIKQIYLFCV